MENLRELVERYGALAWRRRWWAFLGAALICIAGWVAVAVLPNQYEAEARVYIDSDAFLTPLLKGIAVESSLEDELDLLQRMLLSRPNLERIIQKTDLQFEVVTPTDTERLVDRLARQIQVVPQTRNIFSIAYRNTNRQLASDVVQAMLASFIENKAGDNRDEMDRASGFIDGQIAEQEARLRDAETKRAAFRKKYVDLLPGDSGVNRLEQGRIDVQSLTGQLEDAKSSLVLIKQQLAETPATYGGGESYEVAAPASNPALKEAEEKLRELQQIYTSQYPEVVSQQRLVNSLRSAGSGAVSGGVRHSVRPTANPIYDQLRLRLVDTESEIESLQRKVAVATAEQARLEAIAKGAPELEAQYQSLNRDYDVIRKNYDELVSRREGMRISDAAQKKASNIKMVIIDPPTVPRIPVAPNRPLLSVGVLVAGLGAGLGIIVALLAMDQSFHTLTELRGLGYPVIGSVSLAALQPTMLQRMREVSLFGGACALLLAGLAGILLHFNKVV
jgi:polysaccharide chain length determinant protein (PEP-CTERM system associated)